ncbi:MAG: hypothetical protein U0528_02780 [Anaerolineae bacterium]|nr:hypothetical protein [Anaerolineae bacterium]
MIEFMVLIDLSKYRYGRRVVEFYFDISTGDSEVLPPLEHEALLVGNGIEVIQTESSPTRRYYSISIDYTVCVGSDKEHAFDYPFINDDEIFIASGLLPHLPAALTAGAWARIAIMGVPDGWTVFTNIIQGDQEAEILHSFFLYCAKDINVRTFQQADRHFEFVVPTEDVDLDSLWISIEGCLKWLSNHLLPYRPEADARVLLLRAPADFEQIANGRTFATGENMLGGIITFAPRDPAYLRKLFGYEDYDLFLRDGMIHELFHYYASGDPAAATRSLLIPTADCSPDTASLLGEALTGYLHRLYLTLTAPNYERALAQFLNGVIVMSLRRKRRHQIALWLLDMHLRQHNSSLFDLLRVWLAGQQDYPVRFSSLDDALTIAKRLTAAPVPAELVSILDGSAIETPLYRAAINSAVAELGFVLKETDGMLELMATGQPARRLVLPVD